MGQRARTQPGQWKTSKTEDIETLEGSADDWLAYNQEPARTEAILQHKADTASRAQRTLLGGLYNGIMTW